MNPLNAHNRPFPQITSRKIKTVFLFLCFKLSNVVDENSYTMRDIGTVMLLESASLYSRGTL